MSEIIFQTVKFHELSGIDPRHRIQRMRLGAGRGIGRDGMGRAGSGVGRAGGLVGGLEGGRSIGCSGRTGGLAGGRGGGGRTMTSWRYQGE